MYRNWFTQFLNYVSSNYGKFGMFETLEFFKILTLFFKKFWHSNVFISVEKYLISFHRRFSIIDICTPLVGNFDSLFKALSMFVFTCSFLSWKFNKKINKVPVNYKS